MPFAVGSRVSGKGAVRCRKPAVCGRTWVFCRQPALDVRKLAVEPVFRHGEQELPPRRDPRQRAERCAHDAARPLERSDAA